MGALLKKELKSQLFSPILAVGLALFLFLTGFAFTTHVTQSTSQNLPEASMRGMIYFMAVILLFICPFLSMRVFSEEIKSGTMELLKTCPLSDFQIALGKYLASLVVLGIFLAATLEYPLFILMVGNPEGLPMVFCYLGLFLLGASFLALGFFASALTKNQVIAAILTFVPLLTLWFLGDVGGEIGEEVALINHLQSFSLGVLDSSDLFYYLAFISFFLLLTVRYLEAERWR